METKELVKKYVEDKIKENDQIIGTIFYGSKCYGTDNQNSDIDLLFITAKGPTYRGVEFYEKERIEYFIKSYETLKKECLENFSKQETYLLSVFQNGEIIYNPNDILNSIKKYLLLRHRSTFPMYPLEKDEKRKIINMWQDLNQLEQNKDESFWIVYFNLLNELRIAYQKKEGYSRIPTCKVREFYENKSYAEKYYCSILPEEEFTEQFLKCLKQKNRKEAKENIAYFMEKLYLDTSIISSQSIIPAIQKENYYPIPKDQELKRQAPTLITKYLKTLNSLEKDQDEARFLYATLIEILRKFYEVQCGVLNDSLKMAKRNYQATLNNSFPKIDPEFVFIYQNALLASTNEEKISALKEIYRFALKDISIEVSNYRIKIPN